MPSRITVCGVQDPGKVETMTLYLVSKKSVVLLLLPLCGTPSGSHNAVRTSPDIMEKISNLMPFRSKCLNTLKKQLGMENSFLVVLYQQQLVATVYARYAG